LAAGAGAPRRRPALPRPPAHRLRQPSRLRPGSGGRRRTALRPRRRLRPGGRRRRLRRRLAARRRRRPGADPPQPPAAGRPMRFTIPNLLSLLRMALVAPFIIALLNGQARRALLLVVIAGVSDALDGLIARFFHQESLLGTYLDPLADKLLIISS